MKKCYVPKRFNPKSAKVIERANKLLEEYAGHGITITLRSLYYRFVANNWCRNHQSEYKKLGKIIGDARLAGRIDWNHLEDRTRNLASLEHFNGPQDALNKLVGWYHVDMWANQKYRPEVWLEKDAVVGNIQRICTTNDVPYFSCRGYTSLTEMYWAGVRLSNYAKQGYTPYIIHFGDHDPSGIDMSRDILDRLAKTFMAEHEFIRVALNMDQIKQYNPPPNPAKTTDKRYRKYQEEYGDDSWELDALDPLKFGALIEEQLNSIRDDVQWAKDVEEKARVKARLKEVAEDWDKPHGSSNVATSGPPPNLPWAGRKREEPGDEGTS